MRITRTDNSETNVTLKVRGDSADLAPIKRHVLGHFVDQVKIPGFRTGKAPLELVEKHSNPQQLTDQFMEHALNDLFVKAIQHEKLRPIGQPDVQVKKFVPYTDLEFEVTVDVIGPIALPDYKKIKLAKAKVEVTASDVNDVIEGLRRRLAERKQVERASKNGDEVVIDFSGKDASGQPVAGAEGKDYPLILGSKTFIPGFEEHLVGMKAGDAKEFTVTFPKDYGVAALQGRKVTFTATTQKVSELEMPKADDELAKKSGTFTTLKELKDDIKKQVKSEKQLQADRDYENRLIKTIADKSKLSVPASLVEDQIDDMERQEKQNLSYRGQTWEEHLEQEGITEQEHRDRQRPDATERVKAGLVLSEISQAENIHVSPEELEIRLQILRGQYQDPAMIAQLNLPENRRDIENRLLTEKTIQKLVDYASK